jgi:Bacterial protein of unknown function (DUF899)
VGFVIRKDSNFDYPVSFAPEQIAEGKAYYNYEVRPNTLSDEVGISVFYKNERSETFHTYSCYSRRVDMLNGTYHYLDLAPKAATRAASNSRWSGYAGTVSIEALRSAATADLTTSNCALRGAAGNGARIMTYATFPANDPERAPSRTTLAWFRGELPSEPFRHLGAARRRQQQRRRLSGARQCRRWPRC